LDVLLDKAGFIDVDSMAPVSTNRQAIFTCGSVSGPKDIPESVIEASGAASAAAAVLGEAPVKKIVVDIPAQRDLRGEPPRIGVYVCRCGINIASVVDVPEVVRYAEGLPGVKFAAELMFSCAQDSQKAIRAAIAKHKLNRLVVAACTPRTHEPLFQKTLEEAGVNPYMFEFANIREQCSWVHQKEPEKATRKARDLIRAAVVKVKLSEPLYKKSMGVNKSALVIGGGLAGMTAALDLADQNFNVTLVEKKKELGGNLLHVQSTLSGRRTAPTLLGLVEKIYNHPHITTFCNTQVKNVSGYVGNFTTQLDGAGATIEHGVVVVASGGQQYQPTEYEYGTDKRILTQRDFETRLFASDAPCAELLSAQSIVMIQCVGSRGEKRGYCSRVCCSNAIKNALRFKELNPKASVYVLFRDIRSYGLREQYYRKAREKGVIFIRFEEDKKPVVKSVGNNLSVSVRDVILGKTITLKPDFLVLSAGITANPDNKALSQLLKVPLEADGFFLEAHVKLRPVDFATDGVFVCGLAHYPKDIGETIAQARAAAGRAATVLSKDTLESEGKISSVRRELCSGCGTCVAVCAYNAISLDPITGCAVINETLCKGCGACAASCRANAVDLSGFNNEQILSMLGTL
jgi:heterodisulfide reductase subunit A